MARNAATHREIVNERRFPEWGLALSHVTGTYVVCPNCHMSVTINLERFINSLITTDLRPCPYCWKLSRVPTL